MLVTAENFDAIVAHLQTKTIFALDTETTGLRSYHGDKLFSVIIADEDESYYFNFHPEHAECLTLVHLSLLQVELFSDATKTFILHNAKFDLAFLSHHSCEIAGHVYDTKAVARVLRNDLRSLSLASLSVDLGQQKSEVVEDYIAKHALWAWESVPGKNKRIKNKFYSKVPLEIIQPYAELDARLTYDLYLHQRKEIERIAKDETLPEWPSIHNVVVNESLLTKVLFDMERRGVRIDREFCHRAIAFEEKRKLEAAEKFEAATGYRFKNSSKIFKEVFKDEKWTYGKVTAGGKVNPVFDADVLATFRNPVAQHVLDWRDAKSKADFYHGFIWQADHSDTIHCNFNQDGTVTGRFSSSEPNLQNLSRNSEDESVPHEFAVRRAIVPRLGTFFVMLDFSQMEYRLLLDYIGAKALIQKVQDGFDVHEATAQIVGLQRAQAKTVNFGIIYGQGPALLAKSLGVTMSRAKEIRNAVYNAIPELYDFVQTVQRKAETRGFVFNWFGRRCHFPDKKFCYRAVNHIIQGGCADVVKIAMVRVHELLRGRQSKMVLQIHDEIVLEFVASEAHLIPEVKAIMENAYSPVNGLPLTCGVEHSFKSLADKVEGYPQ